MEEADDKPECSEGYTYNETIEQCELDDTNGNGNGNGNGEGDETEGMDVDTLMKYWSLRSFSRLRLLY